MGLVKRGTIEIRRVTLAALCTIWVLSACTYVPFDQPRPTLPPKDIATRNAIEQEVSQALANVPGESAYVPLVEGNDALGARLAMIKAAQTSIDVQTFLMKPDLASGLIVRELLEAADRGVVVRFLIDDVFTTTGDAQLGLLESHPNIFVRLYNPMSRRSTTVMNYVLDFDRVNRRMHNKVFLMDGALAIIGGRNIGDEYYQINTDSEFADFDLFIAGPAARELEASFDKFWDDKWAVPAATLAGDFDASPEKLNEVRQSMLARAGEAERTVYERAVNSQFLADVRAGKNLPFYGPSTVVSDIPEKLRVPVREAPERHIAEALVNRMYNAQQRVTLFTPYFVPEDWGARLFSDLAQRGVRVRIVTNSLAANNHAYVHAGYMRHREDLLKAGVELYEVRADVPALLAADGEKHPKLTMHTKATVIDGAIMIGSLNFDPRSIKINSELGVFIENPGIADQFERETGAELALFTYRLQLDENDRLQWVYENDGRREVYTSEPGASFGQKAIAGITRLLPVEGQL